MDDTVSRGESWRTQWPASAAVDAWYLAAADKALHITDSFGQIHELGYLVERLTSRGSIEAAQRVCDDLLRQLPVYEGDRLDRVVVYRVTAAEALWSVDREDEALTMLAQTLTMLGHGGRTNKRNRLHIQYVRERALKMGVLGEWFSDITEAELATLAAARQRRALARVDLVLRQEGAEAARVQLHATLPPTAPGAARMWRRYAAVGDTETARRLFESLAPSDQERESCWSDLVGLGQRDRVLRLASQAITAHLEEARAMALPNFHHVAGAIVRTLECLREAGEVDAVRLHLSVVLHEVATWDLAWSGWAEAAVRSAFAGVVARLDGLPRGCWRPRPWPPRAIGRRFVARVGCP